MGKNKSFALEVYEASKHTDVSPLFITAQACLETGWGKSKIGKYNLWGIKASPEYKGHKVLVRTTEIIKKGHTLDINYGESIVSKVVLKTGNIKYIANLWFRDYDSLSEAIMDHNSVLRSFKDAWAYRHDPNKFIEALQEGKKKYATSPTYVSTMKAMYSTLIKMGIE